AVQLLLVAHHSVGIRPYSGENRRPPDGSHRGRHVDSRKSRAPPAAVLRQRSEEHTSELQSRFDLVCRLLLEKKKLNAQQTSSSLLLSAAAVLFFLSLRRPPSLPLFPYTTLFRSAVQLLLVAHHSVGIRPYSGENRRPPDGSHRGRHVDSRKSRAPPAAVLRQ